MSSVTIYYAPKSNIRVKSQDNLNFSRASVVQFRASRYIMLLNRIPEWKLMTIWISRELPFFTFKRLDILFAWIGHPSEKLWPFEFLESLCCPISSVSTYYAPESDIWVKSYVHLNFSRASVSQFRASRYIISRNRTSVWKVMTIWTSRELPLFNFERLDILFPGIEHSWIKLWPFEFLLRFCCSISSVLIYYAPKSDIQVKSYDNLNFSRASVVQFRASRYIIRLNRTSEWKVMTIWISRELLLANFERLDILCARIGHLSEKLWPFEFLESFRFSISSISIYYFPESDIRVKCYDHLNFLRASIVQCRASRYIMRQNRTSEWKVRTIWISRELLYSISSVSIYYAPESDTWVKTYGHLNFSRASVFHFRASQYNIHLIRTSEGKGTTIWTSQELPLFNFERLDILFACIGNPREKL